MRRLTRWLPWRFAIRRIAHVSGFMDPMPLVARLARFAQPSEVGAPIELLRAGVVFHARGLLNTKAIQSNLDWVWPYWIVRQFDPLDDSFVPRSFSITHVNLSHRNWTAIGVPGVPDYPVVDPRGLVMPFFDGWSIDGWVLPDGEGAVPLYPSQSAEDECEQHYGIDRGQLCVTTRIERDGVELVIRAWVEHGKRGPVCRVRYEATSPSGGRLAVSLRPVNPEGVTEINELRVRGLRAIEVNDNAHLRFSVEADDMRFSNYSGGDVAGLLAGEAGNHKGIRCDVGMATAAMVFNLAPGEKRVVETSVDLKSDPEYEQAKSAESGPVRTWEEELAPAARMRIPDARLAEIYDNAVASMILHAPQDVYPGPFTYKRFWFRDAALILNAMLAANLIERSERVIAQFPARQTRSGYFRSQEGEWDSNGQVLWILHRWQEMTNKPLPPEWHGAVRRGAEWIRNKRLPKDSDSLHAGLLPAGFSAEHLGNNDYYLWDDFWAVGGLRAAAAMARRDGDSDSARRWEVEADDLYACIERSRARSESTRGRPAWPASPHRRMDEGAIGSIAVGYPLQIDKPCDERLVDLAEYLYEDCFVRGGFFQNMIHSGINAYLTVHVAQVFLRAGDPRFVGIIKDVARYASPTGQWPEAINPRTGGGCMGDGHHIWACAEWVVMMRNLFVREEEDRLVVGAGIFPEWLAGNEAMLFGPTPTPFGTVTVHVEPDGKGEATVRVEGRWHNKAPMIEVALPGSESRAFSAEELQEGIVVSLKVEETMRNASLESTCL